MNVVSGVSLALLIVCMFTCSFAVERHVKRPHDDDDFPVLPSAVIFLNILVSVAVTFANLEWGHPASWSEIVVYLAVANFMISLLSLGLLSKKTPPAGTKKYIVKRIIGSGMGAVSVSKQEFRDRAIHDAYQLAKKNSHDVFEVIDTRGNRIATVNHSDVSIQTHN